MTDVQDADIHANEKEFLTEFGRAYQKHLDPIVRKYSGKITHVAIFSASAVILKLNMVYSNLDRDDCEVLLDSIKLDCLRALDNGIKESLN